MDPITIAMGLAQVAPQIIRWVSGSNKAGDAAQEVVDIAQAVVGTNDPVEALAKITSSQQLQIDFRKAIMENETDLDKAFLADRQNARDRDVKLAQTGRYNWRSDMLALLAVGGLVLCVYFIAKDSTLPERAVNAIMFVAGVLAAAVRDVYSFEFGSSRGSKDKDGMLSKVLK